MMRLVKICGAITIFGLMLASPVANAAQNAKAQAEVDKAVHEIVAAYGEGPAGLEKYFTYYADDMTVYRSNGRWTKADYYKLWSDLNGKGGGVSSAEIRDLQIQISPAGDAAVTTYEMPVTRRGQLQPGQDPNVVWYMSEVWFKEKGKWLVSSLFFVDSALAKRAAAATAAAAPAPAQPR